MALKLAAKDFRVGWICAIQVEYVAACEFLDEEYPDVPNLPPGDYNVYTCGRIGKHHVVIACLPKGRYGLAPAASVARDMLRSFPTICVRLMVGIGGGAPSPIHDIRLGDVVVSVPSGRTGGVVHYEFGKTIQDKKFEFTGALNGPPQILLNAVQKLSTLHERGKSEISAVIDNLMMKNPKLRKNFGRPNEETDVLFHSDFLHSDPDRSCMEICDLYSDRIVERPTRAEYEDQVQIHYGLIASADRLMKDANVRDSLTQSDGVLCFEMEAAGLMNHFSCLVIRGICDYSDTHKNKSWQGYAATTAAAYAKELLNVLPNFEVDHVMQDIKQQIAIFEESLSQRMREEGLAVTTSVQNILKSTESRLSESLQNWREQSFSLQHRDKLLGSLRFEDINLRFNEVETSNAKTFEWVFERESSSSSLHDWLRCGSGMYWIRGKAGSGKSTFTKFIVQHKQTQDALQRWQTSLKSPTRILKHFFWLSGSFHQRNTKGFLCSLLLQMLQQDCHFVNELLQQQDLIVKESLNDWSVTELSAVLNKCFDGWSRNYCIFVDALDEIDRGESIHEILKLIESWQSKAHVKCCVSSRPESIFVSKFGVMPQLKLEDLTYADMRNLMQDYLQPFRNSSTSNMTESDWTSLEYQILSKADGVFLWLRLALKNITDGVYSYDNATELSKRLELLPSRIDQLYTHMWERMNPNLDSCRREAALYLKLLLVANDVIDESLDQAPWFSNISSLDLMIAAENGTCENLKKGYSIKAADVMQLHGTFLNRLLARTAGLIEITRKEDESYVSPPAWFVTDGPNPKDRKVLMRGVRFMHRTAYDFLLSSEEGKSILSWCDVSAGDFRFRLAVAFLFTIHLGVRDLTEVHVNWAIRNANRFSDKDLTCNFLRLLSDVSRKIFIRNSGLLDPEDWYFYLQIIGSRGLDHLSKVMGFDSMVAAHRITSYFQNMEKSTALKFDQMYLDEMLLSSLYENVILHKDWGELPHWLLDQGANPCATTLDWRGRLNPPAFAELLLLIIRQPELIFQKTRMAASLVQHCLDKAPDLSTGCLLEFETSTTRPIERASHKNWFLTSMRRLLRVEVNIAELLRITTEMCRLQLAFPANATIPVVKPYRKAWIVFDLNERVGLRVPSQGASKALLDCWDKWFTLQLLMAPGIYRPASEHGIQRAKRAFDSFVDLMNGDLVEDSEEIHPWDEFDLHIFTDLETLPRIQPFDPPGSWKYVKEARAIACRMAELEIEVKASDSEDSD